MQTKKICKNCGNKITSKHGQKFCSHSCSATYNNTGIRRHGLAPHKCKGCATMIPGRRTWCSNACQGRARQKYHTEEEKINAKRKRSRECSMRYYGLRKYQTPHDADLTAVKKFYKNCPEGYEVDHIMPVSKGGTHSINNLQYLTRSENRRKSNKII